MRESNFAFPAQNRACVCISSQLYDRRALDTTSPLPLFNSLHHLTYLTSTSPRIREIMTMDGGLERLVRILHDFCICPPPPENPNIIYGLGPPNSRRPKLVPTLNPSTYDKHAAYRFSLAFQCVVNIGVRGSEPIRSRVVQAGTLDVVGCILEAWLANKGFAVGPSSSATGLPRESREQRLARRQALAEQRQREEAAELTRALQRQIAVGEVFREERTATDLEAHSQDDAPMVEISVDSTAYSEISVVVDATSSPVPITARDRPSYGRHSSSSSHETEPDTSAETSTNATPLSSGTPTGAVLVNTRERSGTIIARPVWDAPSTTAEVSHQHRSRRTRATTASPPDSTDNSRPDTETEDDGDVDMDQSQDTDENEAPTRATRLPTRSMTLTQRPRRAVGIVSDAPENAPLEVNADAHIIINHGQGGVVDADGVGVEDGIVSLEPNDDFAMGAPPGAPGAMDETVPARNIRGIDTAILDRRGRAAPDATPRANIVPLPAPLPNQNAGGGTVRTGVPVHRGEHTPNPPSAPGRASTHAHHHREQDSGPFKDEDVLLSLQLLAYLSKYPHVRQAFYKPRTSFHPASASLPNARPVQQPVAGPSVMRNAPQPAKEPHGFLRVFASATARGKEKEKAPINPVGLAPSPRMTNVFSLVERFTFRPSSSESDLPNPPPKLPPEIQYWAGVIMRNACRKDDNRGGIRQCANMLCGRWESYPREFAKCRRCRKAKYCGKECQSTAWSEGHRFWCSAKDGDEDGDLAGEGTGMEAAAGEGGAPATAEAVTIGRTETVRADRRGERDQHTRERGGAVPTVAEVFERPRATAIPPTQADTVHTGQSPARTRQAHLHPHGPFAAPPNNRVHLERPRLPVDGTRPDAAMPWRNPFIPGPHGNIHFAQLHNRRRAETVSGATTVGGAAELTPVFRRTGEVFLSDGRGGDPDDDMDAAGPSRGRRGVDNPIWESSQGDNDMVIG
ncbi:hypothetical protein BV22DRAFT_1087158 [Leucogyrophana mollusca]|uniref:Uncharacterized protein n=1 Tax=Leucogyrophana mollusca TaxID=85980 RepID=A0ACB8BLA9_9AGAM|nr:hypothetical protein BV22DRAFT_1087158 [Leucogyrophana mollusca]